MIIVGYPGIGKSTVAKYRPPIIDLESSSFSVAGEKIDRWYIAYCDIAKRLSKDGYTVFVSSHKEVRDEFNKRGIEYTVITPSAELKDAWLNRLYERYMNHKSEKNLRAYEYAKEHYDQNVEDLVLSSKNCIQLTDINYNLLQVLINNGLY